MKAYVSKLIVVFILLYSSNTYCQYVSPPSIANKTVKKGQFDLSYKDLVGTVYIDNNYKLATVSFTKTKYLTRYDAYNDQMEIDVDDQQYYLPKTLDCLVTFNDKTYCVYSYNGENHFFKIGLNSPKLKLLIKEKIKLTQEVESNGIVAFKPRTLKRIKDQFFYSKNNGEVLKLPKNKKDFYAIFSEDSKNIKSFVKKNKYSIKEASDLIEIFKYYNSLK